MIPTCLGLKIEILCLLFTPLFTVAVAALVNGGLALCAGNRSGTGMPRWSRIKRASHVGA